ncbi:DUF6207 family protein [Streptomyces sp. NPDC048383]|uniref:DUF6207 family protein n=1 Tax=Streptomyces sp. NPDC048383 TaxID=3155386 RepID=UPI0034476279
MPLPAADRQRVPHRRLPADEDTVRAAVDALGRLYATSGPGRLRRAPGQAGVRVYADLLRPGGQS